MAAVEIAKPDTHTRTYSYIELENGLKAVIGSDPECDKAGGALCVNVGMCHERKDLPALAHFLEHMLFTGTTKYPKEGEYHEFIQQNGGMANAYTTCWFTNYMFEVKPEVLDGALDRFSRFFIEPLLTRDCTSREINAVDSEFQAGHTEPWWRYVGIMNMIANPEHPFHVAVGNNKVLLEEPKEKGIDLYDEMIKFYNSTYSSNGMGVCIFGKESVAEMEAMVREKFGKIVNKRVTMPIGDSVSDKPPFLLKDWHRLLLQNPVKDIKELVFSWVLPYQGPLWRTKPSAYVSHLLGYEGAGSVISVLKQQGLITGCMSGDGSWLEGAFSLVVVTFELTDKGLESLEEIGAHLFAFIGLLQRTPVEKWIFDEMSNLRKIMFKFGEDANPFDLCPDMALSLLRYPPSEVLAGETVIYEYDPEAISSIINTLRTDNVRVSHQAKSLADRCTEKDTSYDSPIANLPLEESWMARWSAAISPGDGSAQAAIDAAAAMGLHLPKPNPFIPEDLSLRDLPADPPRLPVPLVLTAGSGAPAVSVIFHRQDDTFKQPKAHVVFHIYSSFMSREPKSWVMAELWCRAIEEALSEYAYDAEVAGVSYGLSLRGGTISLTVSGFNDKLGVLLDAVTEKMVSMVEIPETIFSIVADKYADEIRNAAFHSAPYQQCGMRWSELMTRGQGFPAYLRYEAFQTLKREDLSGIPAHLFSECHVEAMVLGNATPDDARKLCASLAKGLRLERPLAVLPERANAVLPAGATLWSLDSTDEEDPNHAVFLRVQFKENLESDMLLSILGTVLGNKFFDILRTQQQLGYIVQLGGNPGPKFSYLVALVQTEFPPDFVRTRIDAFLDDHVKFVMETLDEEEFNTCREGIISDLKMKPKNLMEEMSRYSRYFNDRSYDFGRRQRAINFLETGATLEALRSFVKEDYRQAPRLYTQVKKLLAKEDKPLPEGATVPEDPKDLRKWAAHAEVVESFKGSATWVTYDTAVAAAAL